VDAGDGGVGTKEEDLLCALPPVLQLLALTLVATVDTLLALALLYLVNALLVVDVLIIELRQLFVDDAMDEIEGAGVLRCVNAKLAVGECARSLGSWYPLWREWLEWLPFR